MVDRRPVRRDRVADQGVLALAARPGRVRRGLVGLIEPARSRNPTDRRVSARQILGPLLGEVAFEQSGGLADFDHVAIRVPHVAADLGAAVNRRRHELGSLRAPLLVARLDVGDPQVHEDRDRVARFVVDDRDVGLVGGGPAARIHDHPRVGELDHARVLLEHDPAAEDLGVEGARPSHAPYRDELGDNEALARGGQVREVDGWRVFGHGSVLLLRVCTT